MRCSSGSFEHGLPGLWRDESAAEDGAQGRLLAAPRLPTLMTVVPASSASRLNHGNGRLDRNPLLTSSLEPCDSSCTRPSACSWSATVCPLCRHSLEQSPLALARWPPCMSVPSLGIDPSAAQPVSPCCAAAAAPARAGEAWLSEARQASVRALMTPPRLLLYESGS